MFIFLHFSFKIGTTVSVRSLFNRFPVRRTELRSHAKREFSQALNSIQSFALISRQVQFLQVFSSADSHPPTNPLLTLTPSKSLKDTLAQVFGQKILESITHIDDNDDDTNKEFKVIFRMIFSYKFIFDFLVRWFYFSTSTRLWSFIIRSAIPLCK